jgi:putative SOS response-associated peptidase YedK
MCGRFSLTRPEALVEAFGVSELPAGLAPHYNIAPSQTAVVVVARPQPSLALFRWGLVPPWADSPAVGNRLINARSETAASKPAFRDALRRRRCLVPADGFFEWKRTGKRAVPHYVRRADQRIFAMAGLWERWRDAAGEELHSFAILTAPASRLLAAVHHRMPVLIEPVDHQRWLHPGPLPPDALADLLRTPSDAGYEMYEVSTVVNSAAHDEPACVAPAAAQQLPLC